MFPYVERKMLMTKQEIRESVVLMNDDEKIFGVFHKPLNTVNCPAILMCHGFAGQKTGRFRLYVDLAEALAKAGIAVLRIDFRGCGDSEGDFLTMTPQAQVSDALKGLEFLCEQKEIDCNRIGIFGRSLGGMIAILAAATFQNIKSICLWAPLFSADSFEKEWKFVRSTGKKEPLVMNGQAVSDQFLKELFSTRLEEQLECVKNIPFMHVNAEKDSVVTAEQKQKYQKCRSTAPALTEFIFFPNSDHEFSNHEERFLALQETVSWFQKTLCKL